MSSTSLRLERPHWSSAGTDAHSIEAQTSQSVVAQSRTSGDTGTNIASELGVTGPGQRYAARKEAFFLQVAVDAC